MSISAVSSAAGGLNAAMAWFDAAAAAAARTGLPRSEDAAAPAATPSEDLVGAVTGTTLAAGAVDVQTAVLRTALETERSLVDVLA